jgi:hypothetical protein
MEGKSFFYFFSRNPLKRPNPKKEKKGNESFFPFIFLACPCSELARWLNRRLETRSDLVKSAVNVRRAREVHGEYLAAEQQ